MNICKHTFADDDGCRHECEMEAGTLEYCNLHLPFYIPEHAVTYIADLERQLAGAQRQVFYNGEEVADLQAENEALRQERNELWNLVQEASEQHPRDCVRNIRRSAKAAREATEPMPDTPAGKTECAMCCGELGSE